MKKNLKDLTLDDLTAILTAEGYPAHRAAQIFQWVNARNINDISLMTNVPRSMIEKLRDRYFIGSLILEKRMRSKKDGTEKFLWRLHDDARVETVLIPGKGRKTICLSTQVGCKFGCPFCASGKMGFVRDLTPGEITDQVLSVQELKNIKITNVVFMGMGEPLDNYNNLVKAIKIINHRDGIGIGARKITVSTCGVVPGIRKLKNLGIQVELSVSLHSAIDVKRSELVPVNRKYSLSSLLATCREYYEKTGRIITFEYTVIKGVNDSNRDVEALVEAARQANARVNLITCSNVAVDGLDGVGPEVMESISERLRKARINVTVRRSRGDDIAAACGQLAAEYR
ncbi:MAG: 23S rRNA (adenine(2503)-C(2))-methyltransferase RlmN [Candidatus Omnitrophica bacterium]|nr:23S rRNA (adenine(2503)-C(2))-methyltransferase RlmN [Candidatus Omnitrophota bacterium]MDD5488260.1 23S rRNA (adenine(2503)-C(2))-methyltransferase RlmN [Candidatus Omnitrophota bacterium]